MLMAIIEFELNPDIDEEFMGVIVGLQSEIAGIDGFISADASQSLKHAGLMYEVSYWRDEAALARWSENAQHLDAKKAGHDRLLKWYRIRVADVNRDWSHGTIPADSPAAAS